jgi:hypothetical protein
MGDSPSDEALDTRQARLQAEAADVLATLHRAELFDGLGPPRLAGSVVSGLMCWRDLDVMVLAGPGFTPHDVLRLLDRAVAIPGVVGFGYRDERGPRSPTGEVRDERYHVPITLRTEQGDWRVDLSIWLHDPHTGVTRWHETLRDTITADQRRAVLQIKDVWHRLPGYPDEVSGVEIYTAVLEHGVRTPDGFAAWLASRSDRPDRPDRPERPD